MSQPEIRIDKEGWMEIAMSPFNLFDTFFILTPRPDCEDAYGYAARNDGSLLNEQQLRLIFHEAAQRWHLREASLHSKMEEDTVNKLMERMDGTP